MIEITLATLAGVKEVAANLREEDLREVKATVGDRVEAAVVASFRNSSLCWLVSKDGKPFMVFGVCPSEHGPRMGCPWMLATSVLADHTRELLQLTRWYVDLMSAMYPTLFNFVDKRSTRNIRWLRWAGFTMGEEVPTFGVEKTPFITFYRIRNVH